MFSAIEEHFLRIFRFPFMKKKKKKRLIFIKKRRLPIHNLLCQLIDNCLEDYASRSFTRATGQVDESEG